MPSCRWQFTFSLYSFSLKAEWLYSQGRGRSFGSGDNENLVQYLVSTCPISGADDLQSEEDEKLSKILMKAKQHQTQLHGKNDSPKSNIPTKACNGTPRNSKVTTPRKKSPHPSKNFFSSGLTSFHYQLSKINLGL